MLPWLRNLLWALHPRNIWPILATTVGSQGQKQATTIRGPREGDYLRKTNAEPAKWVNLYGIVECGEVADYDDSLRLKMWMWRCLRFGVDAGVDVGVEVGDEVGVDVVLMWCWLCKSYCIADLFQWSFLQNCDLVLTVIPRCCSTAEARVARVQVRSGVNAFICSMVTKQLDLFPITRSRFISWLCHC